MNNILSNSRRAALKNDANRFAQKILHLYSLCATVALPSLFKSKGYPNNNESSIHSKDLCDVIPIDSHRVYISDPMRLAANDTKATVSDE